MPGGAVMVDAQLQPVQQRQKHLRKQGGRCHIHADDGVIFLRTVLGQSLMEVQILFRDLHIAKHMGGFA